MLNAEYIIGLVDGEGSFTAYIKNPEFTKNVKRWVRAEPKFYLKLIERDSEILFRLKKFFGCGEVYFQKDTRKNHQNCYRYEVSNRKDLEDVIIPFFKTHQLQLKSKKRDFEIFCDLMLRIKNGQHLNKQGLAKLYKIKASMH
ncbi:LAGLIDADG family homing endonuclease [Candidatus Giovannonibacteria bacterium]|nr:LAGLIDADG family homing endonuclease [Candidatus Giovannonibacteria bacterium]